MYLINEENHGALCVTEEIEEWDYVEDEED